MSLLSEGGTSSPDFLIFLVTLTLAVLCVILNLTMYLFNHFKPYCPATFLFRILALLDLLTGLVQPAVICHHAISPASSELVFPGDLDNLDKCSVLDSVLGCVCLVLRFMPISVVGVLAVSRYVQIKHPFFHVRRVYLLAPIGVIFLYTLGVASYVSFHVNCRWNPYLLQPSIGILSSSVAVSGTIMIFPSALLTLVSTICSLLTIYELIKRRIRRGRLDGAPVTRALHGIVAAVPGGAPLSAPGASCRRSCFRVVAMHFTNISFMLHYVVLINTISTDGIHGNISNVSDYIVLFATCTLQPVETSLVNPLVFLLFAGDPLSNVFNKIRTQVSRSLTWSRSL